MAILTSPRSPVREPAPERERSRTGTLARAALDSPLADYYLVFGSALLLIGFGVTMVLSSSSVTAEVNFGNPYYYVERQVVFLVVGTGLCWWLSRLRVVFLKFLGWAGLFLALALLLATFVPGLGIDVNGNRNWLQLGTPWLRIQPSEFAKLAMIVWGADVLARKQRVLDRPAHLLLPFMPVSLILVALVVLEKDLGTAMVMLAIMVGILWVVGASLKLLGVMGIAAGAVVFLFVKASPNRVDRILGFVNPAAADPMVTEQSLKSLWALASGGWWGRGLGASRQKWGGLAEAHTDFIFSVLGEELGLLVALIVVALFMVLGWAGLRIARRSDAPFLRYVAAGVTLWFLIQATINIMVVLRLLPVLGVPLPFISYGGSALLANLLALGCLLACARNEPAARRALGGRANRRPRLTTIVDGGRG